LTITLRHIYSVMRLIEDGHLMVLAEEPLTSEMMVCDSHFGREAQLAVLEQIFGALICLRSSQLTLCLKLRRDRQDGKATENGPQEEEGKGTETPRRRRSRIGTGTRMGMDRWNP
jgi:hypothetical protein